MFIKISCGQVLTMLCLGQPGKVHLSASGHGLSSFMVLPPGVYMYVAQHVATSPSDLIGTKG